MEDFYPCCTLNFELQMNCRVFGLFLEIRLVRSNCLWCLENGFKDRHYLCGMREPCTSYSEDAMVWGLQGMETVFCERAAASPLRSDRICVPESSQPPLPFYPTSGLMLLRVIVASLTIIFVNQNLLRKFAVSFSVSKARKSS